jgi:hypothetical protein
LSVINQAKRVKNVSGKFWPEIYVEVQNRSHGGSSSNL